MNAYMTRWKVPVATEVTDDDRYAAVVVSPLSRKKGVTMFRHRMEDVPAYRIWLPERPGLRAKGKERYMSTLRQAASTHVATPIVFNDVEVSVVYSTNGSKGVRADVDNILKPTLDALKGVAYLDDRQVRAVSSRVFDAVPLCVNPTEYVSLTLIDPLLKSGFQDLVVVSIFSDRRLHELGGKEIVRTRIDEEEREIIRKFGVPVVPNHALQADDHLPPFGRSVARR